MTKARTFTNVWDAIEDSPEEAATMTMRSNVMSAIKEKVHGLRALNARTQTAARHPGSATGRICGMPSCYGWGQTLEVADND